MIASMELKPRGNFMKQSIRYKFYITTSAILFLCTSIMNLAFGEPVPVDRNDPCLKVARSAVAEYHQQHANPYYVGLGDLGDGDISEVEGNIYYIMNIWSRDLDNPGECIDFDNVAVVRTQNSCQFSSLKSYEPHQGPRWDCG